MYRLEQIIHDFAINKINKNLLFIWLRPRFKISFIF